VSSANTFGDDNTVPATRAYSGVSHQHARLTQWLNVERSMITPCRASIWDCRYNGSESQNLLTSTCTTIASVGRPPSTGRSGAGATTTASSQARQA